MLALFVLVPHTIVLIPKHLSLPPLLGLEGPSRGPGCEDAVDRHHC